MCLHNRRPIRVSERHDQITGADRSIPAQRPGRTPCPEPSAQPLLCSHPVECVVALDIKLPTTSRPETWYATQRHHHGRGRPRRARTREALKHRARRHLQNVRVALHRRRQQSQSQIGDPMPDDSPVVKLYAAGLAEASSIQRHPVTRSPTAATAGSGDGRRSKK